MVIVHSIPNMFNIKYLQIYMYISYEKISGSDSIVVTTKLQSLSSQALYKSGEANPLSPRR